LDVLATALEVQPPFLSSEEELAAWSAFLSAAFYVRPWHACIVPGLERIESLLNTVGEAAPALRAATIAMIVANRSGDIARAQRLAPLVEMLAAQDWRSPVERAWGLFQLANQRFVRAEYEASREFFDRTWSLAEANGLRAVLTASLTYRFMLEFRLEDRAAVDASMRRILALPLPVHAFSQGLLTCYQARHAQIRGESQVAADLAERANAHILRAGVGFHELNHGLIHGEILLAAGRVSKARPLIQRSRAIVERTPILSNYLPSLLLVEAWLAGQEGREEASHHVLREALQRSQVGYAWCQMRYVDTTCAHMLRIALKHGIEPETATRLIRIFRLKPRETDIAAWPWALRVHALGGFEVQAYGQALEFGRKTPKKALGLLKALVALGPREVPEQQVIDALWPDEEGDAGHKALSVTLLRLRRLLGDNDLIRQQGGRLAIDRQKCWVDAWAFEQRLAQVSLNGDATGPQLRMLEETLALYGGRFLQEDGGDPWAVPMRERLRAKFVHALVGFGTHLEARGRYEDAIAWYLKGLDADAIVEPFYQGLMRCYDRLDRRPEALGAYRRLRQILSATLGLQPSKSLEKLYQSLRLG
jgi:DNA-binding SARP family transcriptional activator